MSTGPIESWSVNPRGIGPLYPFVGWEGFMFAACVVFCLAFLMWKFKTESAKYAAESQQLRESRSPDQTAEDDETTDRSTTHGGP